MFENLIFLSYRQADSAPFTLAIKLELEDHLRAAQVFVDTHHIQGADRWAREIETALRAATVVLPVIGRSWAGPEAQGGHRIDDPQDWVRKEIEIALSEKSHAVLPLLVDGARPPDAAALPAEIGELAAIQAIRLDLNAWEGGIARLVSTLANRFGFARKHDQWKFPKPDPIVARTNPVPWEELDDLVRNHLPHWSIEFSDDEERLHYKRMELTRTFEFASFRETIAFVNTVAEHAQRVDHHPRWMNLWRTVKVWMSTWDAGHRITALDLEFARYLDRTFPRH